MPFRTQNDALDEIFEYLTQFGDLSLERDLVKLKEALGKISARSESDARYVKAFKLYYLIDGSEPLTLKDIGEQFHVTASRARELVRKAMRSLIRSRYWEAAITFGAASSEVSILFPPQLESMVRKIIEPLAKGNGSNASYLQYINGWISATAREEYKALLGRDGIVDDPKIIKLLCELAVVRSLVRWHEVRMAPPPMPSINQL